MFLEAIHFFTVEYVAWRPLPDLFGNWNGVWKRFSRLSDSGVFEAFFEALADLSESAHLVQMFDSIVVRAHVSAAGAKGGRRVRRSAARAAASRPRLVLAEAGIHLKCDRHGHPLAFHLTGGEASDSRQFELLLDIGPDITPRAAITDKGCDAKGYDAKANRAAARKRGICPVIPHRSTTRDKPKFFPRVLYKGRARIEQTMGKLKWFKRVALRCEKTASPLRQA